MNLRKNRLRDEGIGVLARGVRGSKVLVRLDVANNEISWKGLEVLCDAIRENESLVDLNVGNIDTMQRNKYTW